jgi:phosphatidylethanolamine-binding protein (PEBP) family uncharacterized protein
MQVMYNNVPIQNGQRMQVSDTKMQPQVLLPTKGTLIMYDPDAVGEKTYVHWVQVDGKDLLPYAPPSPPPNTGEHRYIFELYNDPDKDIRAKVIPERSFNSVDDLKSQLGLYGPPLYTVQFVSQYAGQNGGNKKKKKTIKRQWRKVKKLKRKTICRRKR